MGQCVLLQSSRLLWSSVSSSKLQASIFMHNAVSLEHPAHHNLKLTFQQYSSRLHADTRYEWDKTYVRYAYCAVCKMLHTQCHFNSWLAALYSDITCHLIKSICRRRWLPHGERLEVCCRGADLTGWCLDLAQKRALHISHTRLRKPDQASSCLA